MGRAAGPDADPVGPGAGSEGGPDGPIEARLTRALVAWVDAVRRRARGALVATGLVTLALGAYAATHLGINTSHTALLSDDLPFWEQYMAFAERFPILDEALLVVVDAETADRARSATDALAERLAQRSDLFESVYAPGSGAFFERHALLYLSVEELEELSDQLASAQPVLAELSRDRSLRNLARMLREGVELADAGGGESLDLSAVFDSLSRAAQAVLEGRPKRISWTDALMSDSSLGGPSRRLVVLEPVLDYSALLPASRPMRAVREVADELALGPGSDVRVRITGNVALNTEEMLTVAWNALVAAAASLALVTLVLLVAMRSARLVLGVVVTLLVGLVWTAAFAAAAVGHLNVISVAFAVLFIGLGVDFGIHLGMRYAELLRGGEQSRGALLETARSVGGSLALCAVTTALGFYVFLPADYRAVAELGLISGTGMLISLFCSLTVLPAYLTLAGAAAGGSPWAGARRFEALLLAAALRHPRAVRRVAAALGIGAVLLAANARFDHNVVTLRDPSTESAQTFAELLAASDTSPWTIDVVATDLAAADALAQRLSSLEFVERAVTLRDYVPAEQEEKLEILADLVYFLPEPPGEEAPPPPVGDQIAALAALRDTLVGSSIARGSSQRAASARSAAEHLDRFLEELAGVPDDRKRPVVANLESSLTGALPDQMRRLWRALDPGPVTLADLPPDLVRRMVAPDGSARVEVLPSGDLSDNAEHARFVDGVRAAAPNATGSAVTLLEWGRAVVRTFQQALVSAVVVVSLSLWLLWRRVADVVLVLAPLLLAAALTAATAVLLGIAFNFGNVVVLPLLLGVGVDSGVHMVHRFREVGARHPTITASSGELLGSSTPQAVLFSATTTIASFGSLALSSHGGFASLGQLLVIGVSYTLLCNLVVLPALIAGRAPAVESAVASDARATA